MSSHTSAKGWLGFAAFFIVVGLFQPWVFGLAIGFGIFYAFFYFFYKMMGGVE